MSTLNVERLNMNDNASTSYAGILPGLGTPGMAIAPPDLVNVQLLERNGRLLSRADAPLKGAWAKPFPLTTLPGEILSQILSYCDPSPVFHMFDGTKPIPLPALAHCGDKTLRLKIIRLLLREKELCVHTKLTDRAAPTSTPSKRLQAWLMSINLRPIDSNFRTSLDAVKHLSFPDFTWSARALPTNLNPTADITLMLGCRSIQEISITFEREHLEKALHGTGAEVYIEWKSAVQLVYEYRLDQMLAVGRDSLRMLNLTVVVRQMDFNRKPNPSIEALRDWFLREFAKQSSSGWRRHAVQVS